jgi:hypothetical protein
MGGWGRRKTTPSGVALATRAEARSRRIDRQTAHGAILAGGRAPTAGHVADTLASIRRQAHHLRPGGRIREIAPPPLLRSRGTMGRFVLIIIVVVIAWQGYRAYRTQSVLERARHDVEQRRAARPVTPAEVEWRPPTSPRAQAPTARCDGRTQCSQMKSCSEATYFLRQCPGTRMDGDADGLPCEQQWWR